MTLQSPKKISQQIVYQKYRTVISKVFELEKSNKNSEQKLEIEVYKSTYTSLVCAFDEQQNLILNRQFRFGPERFLLEFPGGGVNDEDLIKDIAISELMEETGYFSDSINLVESFWDGPYTTGKTHLFLATNCKKITTLKHEPEELIETVLFEPKDFESLIQNPDFIHSSLFCKILCKLGLYEPALQKIQKVKSKK
jgi:ADP-ribose pyrophosphatase